MTDAHGVVSSIYQSGKVYDLLYPGGTSAPAFWEDLAQTYGDPVLEIMSGTGSIAIPLAQAGYDVTGVEMAEPMRGARAQARASTSTNSAPERPGRSGARRAQRRD